MGMGTATAMGMEMATETAVTGTEMDSPISRAPQGTLPLGAEAAPGAPRTEARPMPIERAGAVKLLKRTFRPGVYQSPPGPFVHLPSLLGAVWLASMSLFILA
jgi:hypothetical protein